MRERESVHHKRRRERGRRHGENLGKYIFLISASEVNAAYLGVPTAAAAAAGEGLVSDRKGRQTAHREAFKTEFTSTGVRPCRLIAICCTEEEKEVGRARNREVRGGGRRRGG